MRSLATFRGQGVVAVALVIILLSAGPVAGDARAAPGAAEPLGKIEPEVLQAVSSGSGGSGGPAYWVVMADRADLSPAFEITDWDQRGRFVFERLTEVARAGQAEAVAVLQAAGVDYQPFWIVNAIKVSGSTPDVLMDLAALPSVKRIVPDRALRLVEPVGTGGDAVQAVQAPEWGIVNTGADRVWEEFGITGEGIVVGIVDTGVLYTHPALVNQYRGNNGDGTFDHNYNWYDPMGQCSDPAVPCDDHSHGSHVTGTAVGSDGGSNQIGMAPGARWIASKACDRQGNCFMAQALAAVQFMLAPTDVNGQNPRPELRPHVVNNSYYPDPDGTPEELFYPAIQAWVAAGIMPVFANGNSGPGCGSVAVGEPAQYPESFSVGAHNSANRIAGFSSRGPAPEPFEGIKPNITAPGVAVRSANNRGTYSTFQGTSMAAPHVAGAVALVIAANPALAGRTGDIADLLERTAVPVEDLSCGGTPEHNNVWGHGRLDVYAAVQEALSLELTVAEPADGTVTNRDAIRVSGTATAEQGIQSLTVNGRRATVEEDGSFTIRIPLDEGENLITVTARNWAGIETTAERTVIADWTAPVLEGMEPAHDVTLAWGESLTLRFVSEPGLEAAYQIILAGDAGGWQGGGLPVLGTPMTEVSPGAYEAVFTAPEGARFEGAAIRFYARDAAGNVALVTAPGRLAVEAAAAAPELELTGPEDGTVTNRDAIRVSGAATDEQGIEGVIVNGRRATVAADGTFTIRIPLDEGENRITVVATNQAGWSTTETRTVIADWTAPELQEMEPAAGVTLAWGESLILRFVSEPGLEAAYQIVLDGDGGTRPGGELPVPGTPMSEVSPGVYEAVFTAPAGARFEGAAIRFHARDAAGNLVLVTAPGRLTVVEPAGAGGPRGGAGGPGGPGIRGQRGGGWK